MRRRSPTPSPFRKTFYGHLPRLPHEVMNALHLRTAQMYKDDAAVVVLYQYRSGNVLSKRQTSAATAVLTSAALGSETEGSRCTLITVSTGHAGLTPALTSDPGTFHGEGALGVTQTRCRERGEATCSHTHIHPTLSPNRSLSLLCFSFLRDTRSHDS